MPPKPLTPAKLPISPVVVPGIHIDALRQLAMENDLLELTITHSISSSSRCDLVLSNWSSVSGKVGFPYLSHASIDFGKELKLTLGADTLFSGPISAFTAEYPQATMPQLRIRAEDTLYFKARRTRSRIFENMSSADIFNTVISECAMTAQISGTFPRFKVVSQSNETNLAFLYRYASLVGAEISVSGITVTIKKPSIASSRLFTTLSYGSTLQHFSVIADSNSQVQRVKVHGWDSLNKSRIDEVSSATIPSVPTGARTGPSIVESLDIGHSEIVTSHLPQDNSDAKAFADNAFLASARRFVTGFGIASGSSNMQVGTMINLKGLGTAFSGKYYVTQCTFKYDKNAGSRWEFLAERSYLCP